MKQLNTLGQDDIKPIPSDMKREDIIRHINQIGDVFTLSMKAILEDAFETIAEYPVEIIPHTINGYQRFLDTITKGSSGRIIAGFIIRFKCLLQVELGDEVLRQLEHELISMSANDKVIKTGCLSGRLPTLTWVTFNHRLNSMCS